MNKSPSPVPSVPLITRDVFEGEPAAKSIAVAEVVGVSAGVAPVVVDRVCALDHHIAVIALDVPTFSCAHVSTNTHVGTVRTTGAQVLAIVGDVPGAV